MKKIITVAAIVSLTGPLLFSGAAAQTFSFPVWGVSVGHTPAPAAPGPTGPVGATGPTGPTVYPKINSVSFSSAALTNGSYVTMASLSLTTGVSLGPTGAWIVMVTFQPSLAGTLANAFPCIMGTAAGTNAVGSVDASDAAVCNGSPVNQLAGAFNSARTPVVVYEAQYANSTTVSFTCQFKAGTTGDTASGFCIEEAYPI